jgi:multidrug efflux pump subunit AcrA (membrane-fusion protein)
MKNATHLFLATILAFSFSCTKEAEKVEEAPTESFRNEVAATEVRTAAAERKSFDYLINATGKLEAGSEVMALIEQAGHLLEVNVKEGQYVKKGDIIAKLDPAEAQFRLEKAQIALRNAKAEYESMKFGYDAVFLPKIRSGSR